MRKPKRTSKAKAQAKQPIVEFDFYEVMERAYLPMIQDAVDGNGDLQLWTVFQAGFRTAERWVNNHYQEIVPRVRGKFV